MPSSEAERRPTRRGVAFRGLAAAFVPPALLFAPLGLWWCGVQPPGLVRSAAPPPSIALIESLSELATTRVHVADVLEGENGHYRGRWSLHGEAILGVDLSKATYLRINADKKQAVLVLPPPHLVGSKVDHERSEELYVKAVSWVAFSSPNELRAEVWKHADRKVQRLGQEAAHLERARAQAERVLHKLFHGVGWDIRFEWEDVLPTPSHDAPPPLKPAPAAVGGRRLHIRFFDKPAFGPSTALGPWRLLRVE